MLLCSKCGRSYSEEDLRWRCDCGAPLNCVLDGTPRLNRSSIGGRSASIWRYREMFPLKDDANIVTMGEGMTPLVDARWRGTKALFKLDYVCPTGSYKDRGISLLVSKLRELNVPRIIEDSSGNAGAAMAAYCARAGIECDIYVPDYTSAGKCVQVAMYGARLVRVPGTREDATRAAEEAAASIYYASHNWSPYFIHGIKTLAYEIWEQMGWGVPDNVILPVGQGSLVMGCRMGFQELLEAGEIDRIPRIFAVQSTNCNPLHRAFAEGLDEPLPFNKRETIAEGISSADPVRGRAVLRDVRTSGGSFISVSEEDIWRSFLDLSRLGFYVEPTSAVVGAGYSGLLADGSIEEDQSTVLFLSGSGLKATDKILSLREKMGDAET